ncbi:MerR family transcriptional regulator [Actinacidiphila sp. DG2A-62]|uniref:protein phosphatase 2C domain-containing protein n=1 Tax=Actinacidiphila sp. DG2A-62 TaxID=3108821 RepID=UPI002DB9A387|nr:MerR family transcriptional regulator [Actinacidiphila sp. DG2A-62]MEC3996024.1 MerR family transcriptional regulator [Actinacidiphila sp. DG2A-62]
MDRMSIGAFARASRLSPKALRLYDELGLLTPAYVDPHTGYRFYEPAQLERALLVAWLRRLGMPLARIREVCALDGPRAAREVGAYWARVEAETDARRDLAAFLVDHLAGQGRKDTAVADTTNRAGAAPLAIRYAALTDAGRVRERNQDAVHADGRLLAVADGFGPRGERAAREAVAALTRVDAAGAAAGGVLNLLEDAVAEAGRALRGPGGDAGASGGGGDHGTTLTAMLWTGSQLALVHIGDSRAYLLRGGELFQITHDHTMVQSMVDEGRLTPEEAASHPQRSLLVRALGAAPDASAPELRLHDALAGDRFLLCSDGLSSVVDAESLRRALTAAQTPEDAVRDLVALANASGGPDNIAAVVADLTLGADL